MGIITTKEIKAVNRKMKIMVERYDSAMEVVDDCRMRPITDDKFNDKSKKTFGKWEGVKTYEQALEYMRNGYQPTVDKMKDKLRSLGNIGQQKRMRNVNDVVGGIPIVPLAMMGVPKSMIDTRITPIKCKVIDIYYDVTCSSSTDSEDIIKNGQKLLGAIMELERIGYKFNLYVIQTYSSSNDSDILAVKIKSSNQPLDLKRMSFPLTHTAFFRVIGFDWYSRCPKAKYRSGYGMALSYELSKEEVADLSKKVFGDNSLIIAGKQIMYEDEDYIKEVLENFGKKRG